MGKRAHTYTCSPTEETRRYQEGHCERSERTRLPAVRRRNAELRDLGVVLAHPAVASVRLTHRAHGLPDSDQHESQLCVYRLKRQVYLGSQKILLPLRIGISCVELCIASARKGEYVEVTSQRDNDTHLFFEKPEKTLKIEI